MVLINNIELAWFIGIIGNSVFGMASAITAYRLLIKALKTRNQKAQFQILASATLFSFAIMLLSIVALYWTQFEAKRDFLANETYFPILMWVMNDIFAVLLLSAIITRFSHWSKAVVLGVATITGGLWWSGIKMNSYEVFWRNGAILVYYTDKNAEQINTYLTIIAIVWSFIIVFSYSMSSKERAFTSFASSKLRVPPNLVEDYNTALLMLGSIAMLGGTFFIPRTDPGSITNSASIKIIGYLFFLGFLILYSLGSCYPDFFEEFLRKKNQDGLILHPSIRLSAKQEQELFVTINASIIGFSAIYFGLKFLRKPLLVQPIASEEVKKGNAIFLFETNAIQWYLNLVGGLLPLLVSVILLVVLLTIHDKRLRIAVNFVILVSIEIAITWILNKGILGKKATNGVEVSPVFQHLFFIPILAFLIVMALDKKQWQATTERFQQQNPLRAILAIPYSPLVVYCATVFATIATDFFIPTSPTGKLMIGGAGIFDGIVLIPLQTLLIFTIFLLSSIIFLSYPKDAPSLPVDDPINWD